MADDKSLVGGADRRQLSASDDYEVRDFAEKHDISVEQVRKLIERHGNDREELERAVEQLNAD
jgi:hypothetical protein